MYPVSSNLDPVLIKTAETSNTVSSHTACARASFGNIGDTTLISRSPFNANEGAVLFAEARNLVF